MDLNKVFIIGRLTADPVLRETPGGTSVTTFSVATNRVWNDKAGVKQTEVEYHNVVTWGRQASVVSQYLTKGSMVLVEGRLKTRSWTDKTGGNRKTTEIIADRVQFGPRSANVAGGGGGPARHESNGDSGGFTPRAAGANPKKEAVPQPEEIPVINIEEENSGEIKTEDLPF